MNIVVLVLEDEFAAEGLEALAGAATALGEKVQVAAVPSSATRPLRVPVEEARRIEHAGLTQSSSLDARLHLGLQALAALRANDRPTLVLLPPGQEGETLAARLASRTGGVTLGRCIRLSIDGKEVTAERAAFGGRASMSLRTAASPVYATWRPAPGSVPSSATATEWSALHLDGPLGDNVPRSVPATSDATARLEGAEIVVAGGRGMQGPEGFSLLERLAQLLGAALGGSLPTVDAGWAPVSRQVGQSGKFVAPKLYLAVGISGTLQHMAGISDESTIFALNNDPAAPIFRMASVGVVADWQAVLPLLIQHLEKVT